jgi:putative nucleotidyltransferase with HDIG domain
MSRPPEEPVVKTIPLGGSAADPGALAERLGGSAADPGALAERLSLFYDFVERVLPLTEFDRLIEQLLGDLVRVLRADEGTFFAVDPRRHDLYIRCHSGSRREVVEDFRLRIGEGIAGRVAQDLEPRLVDDASACPDYVPKNNPIGSLISAPVALRGQLLGVININHREGKQASFTKDDLQLLTSLARMGGMALDNAKLYAEVRELLLTTVQALSAAIEVQDPFARGHSERVAFLCDALAENLELGRKERDFLRIAALLHDIGNLALPREVLEKAAPLTRAERDLIKEHPLRGAAILSPVKQLAEVLPGIIEHHERYDGKGYPRHLKDVEISLQGAAIAIAEAVDAMTHDRPYRRAAAAPEALAAIAASSGTQFDPSLVSAFRKCYQALDLEQRSVESLLPDSGEPEL